MATLSIREENGSMLMKVTGSTGRWPCWNQRIMSCEAETATALLASKQWHTNHRFDGRAEPSTSFSLDDVLLPQSHPVTNDADQSKDGPD